MIKDAICRREFQGIVVVPMVSITHLLFVNDILIFCNGSGYDIPKMAEIFRLLGVGTGMVINARKSSMVVHNLEEQKIVYI